MVSCRPFYLPREFLSVIITAVYIPPQVYTTPAPNELCAHPEVAILVGRDFNAGRLKTALPHFHQHVSCATRGAETLHHFYSTQRKAHKALPYPPFGKCDQEPILLLPAYKQDLKQEAPVMRSMRKWSDEADARLQDCFASIHWDMLWD